MKKKAIPFVLKLAIFVGVSCLPEFLLGQQASGVIRPSALGFVFDSGGLRPILGVPGAAVLGTPLDIGLQPVDAALSPRQDYALLLTGEHREVSLLRLDSAGAVASPLDGAIAAPDAISFSPTGNSAALYRADDGLLQVFTDLPDTPRILRELSAATGGDSLTSAAVTDDGQLVLVAVHNNVVVIATDKTPQPLPLNAPAPVIAFRPRAHDAIIASPQTNQVSLFLYPADAPQVQLLAGPDDGILQPLAVAFSLDGRRALVANSGGGLVQLDLLGASPQAFSCDCNITGLHRLAGNLVFRLTDPSAGPLTIFDGDAAQPRVVFVPPSLPSENSHTEGR